MNRSELNRRLLTIMEKESSFIRLYSPSTMFISGCTQSGKTTFLKRLIKNANQMYDTPVHKVMFAYSSWQPIFDQIEQEENNGMQVTFQEGIPTEENLIEWIGIKHDHKLLVIDDLTEEVSSSSLMCKLFTTLSHHKNVSVCLISHNVFLSHQGKFARTISLNAHYMVFFRNRRDGLQIKTIGRQMFPGRLKYFLDSYEKATFSPYGYLFVDLSPHGKTVYQLRTNIFPSETLTIYQPA